MSGILDFYNGKRVFVTGHTGFKGSWLCGALAYAGAEVTGYALEPDLSPSLFELSGMRSRVNSVTGDIRDLEKLKSSFKSVRPEIVFHLAAQPIVREGYRDPRTTFETNIMGTVNILECLRTVGVDVKSVLNVTTDKVYEDVSCAKAHREEEALDGFDPYSSSKCCSEFVTSCYKRSFFQGEGAPAVSTARAGNVIGGGDFNPFRIIPDCVRAVAAGKDVEVRNPLSVRPYQYVLDVLYAYMLICMSQYNNSFFNGSYNVGPDSADMVTTGELADLFCSLSGSVKRKNVGEINAPQETAMLLLDSSKIRKTLGWRPLCNISSAVERTWRWTENWLSGKDMAEETANEIARYFSEI